MLGRTRHRGFLSLICCAVGVAFVALAANAEAPALVPKFEPGAQWKSLPPEETRLLGFWIDPANPGRSITLQSYGGLPASEIAGRPLSELAALVEELRAAIQEPLGVREWRIEQYARAPLRERAGWMLEWEGGFLGVDGKRSRFVERQFVFADRTFQIQLVWLASDSKLTPVQARTLLDGFRLEAGAQ